MTMHNRSEGPGHHELEPIAAYEDNDVVEQRTVGWLEGDIASRINSVLIAVLVAIEGLLATRLLLLLFGANRTSGFVDFVLDITRPLVRPFEGAFTDRTWDEGVFEVSTLLAMVVWLLAFALIMMLISAIAPRTYGGGTRSYRRRITHTDA